MFMFIDVSTLRLTKGLLKPLLIYEMNIFHYFLPEIVTEVDNERCGRSSV